MIDFNSLIGKSEERLTFDIERFYKSLDVKSSHTELRQSQREALAELTARNDERDIVLKISTGAGKTAVGLLFLYAHMRVSRQPVVFLCPTLQLVEQTLEEALRLGIDAYPYVAGETYPHNKCSRGEAITVCSYEKMFNAKTTFARSDVNLIPQAIVLDDAHAGLELIRKAFTLRLSGEAFQKLFALLDSKCRQYQPAIWFDLQHGDTSAALEVPHWIWTDESHHILTLLNPYCDDAEFMFVWPFLRDMLPLCRCIVSGNRAEIVPEILPTDMVRAFESCPHRLFMSATIADDSLLVRELGVSPAAAESPISPKADRGLGERMALVPSLVDPELERGYVMSLCADLARSFNVVVLTSSGQLADDWVNVGAKYFAGSDFAEGVKQLKNPSSGVKFAVFAQRYDGVDLPDDSCRILVIDGVPYGEGLADKVDSTMTYSPGGIRNRTVYRLEQGMGRAVRSHADYCVVLLVGEDLATFVGRRNVLDALTPDSRNQINLSVELAGLSGKSNDNPDYAIKQLISQCLGRDDGWKKFYNHRVRDVERAGSNIDASRISLSASEREAYRLGRLNSALDAIPLLRDAINGADIDREELGLYLQRLSRLAYLADPAEAMRMQQAARDKNFAVSMPPALPRKVTKPGAKDVASRVCEWLQSYANLNAAVIEVRRLCAEIDFANKPEQVEAAIKKLGVALGAESSRPEHEYRKGPDNLWFWGKMFVIEVKSGNKDTLHKSDSGQLHDSLQWATETYPEYKDRVVPLTVSNCVIADADAHYPDDARVLLGEGCKRLCERLHQFVQKMAKQGPVFVSPEVVHNEMSTFELLPEQFGRYTAKVK